jgi:hypothetical protein
VLHCTDMHELQSFLSQSKTSVLHCVYIHNVQSVDACYTQHMKMFTALLWFTVTIHAAVKSPFVFKFGLLILYRIILLWPTPKGPRYYLRQSLTGGDTSGVSLEVFLLSRMSLQGYGRMTASRPPKADNDHLLSWYPIHIFAPCNVNSWVFWHVLFFFFFGGGGRCEIHIASHARLCQWCTLWWTWCFKLTCNPSANHWHL